MGPREMFYERAPFSVGSVQKKAKSKKKKEVRKMIQGFEPVTLLSLVRMQQVHN